MRQSNVVIYHAHCQDGMGAAWAAFYHLRDQAEYVPHSYEEPRPSLDLFKLRHVYIVDYSFPADFIREIAAVATSVTVLDHHKSAQKDLEGQLFPINVTVIFDMVRSGAGITWDWFSKRADVERPRPKMIDYIEDRDLWTWKLPQSHEVNAYIGLMPLKLEAYDLLVDELEFGLSTVMLKGAVLVQQLDKMVGKLCKMAFRVDLPSPTGTKKAMFLNSPMLVSEAGNELLKRNPDLDFVACWFDKSADMRLWSLRANNKFDVSLLAKAFGGGGHPNAAGFNTSTKFMITEIPKAAIPS